MKPLFTLFAVAIFFTACSTRKEILVFSKTEGYRHKSIETGIEAIKKLGIENNINVTSTEDAGVFINTNLKKFDLVIFLNTTGDVFNDEQQVAFKTYINNGGSFMGVHAATDTEFDWPWYNKLVGAYFTSHPNNPNVLDAELTVVDASHASTKHLKARWKRQDEWYNFKSINPDIKVLLNLDETTYKGGENGKSHPIAWYHEYDGGKVFYTAGGHTKDSYSEPDFLKHMLGGIQYCLE